MSERSEQFYLPLRFTTSAFTTNEFSDILALYGHVCDGKDTTCNTQ